MPYKLFITGFIQVFFVAINTVFLSRSFYLGVICAAFLISIVWCFNVKRVTFGTNLDRVLYSSGAALGSVAGLYISNLVC